MLRKKDREWVKIQRKEYEEKTGFVRQRDLRIRKKALKAIDDLTFLAQELSEDQAAQIFNADKLRPFIEAILTLRRSEENERSPVKNERVFRISVMLLRKGMSTGWDLIKSPFVSLLTTGPFANLDYARTVLTIDQFLEPLKKYQLK